MRVSTMIVLSACAAAVSGLAFAAAPSREPPPQVDPVTTIVRIDTNRDGASSREEWVAYGNHDAGFTAMDVDKDGRVTVAELASFRNARRPAGAGPEAIVLVEPEVTIRLADVDRDGRVAASEWLAYGAGGAEFAQVDADRDGRVTAVELTTYRGRP